MDSLQVQLGSSDNDPAYIDNDGTIRLQDLVFSCGLGTEVYPSGKFGFDFPVEKVGGDRYQDSANLIAGNKLEITDKRLLQISQSYIQISSSQEILQ